jgi:hypothetical protein
LIEAELEAQYNLRALRPDFETGMLQQWIARSGAFRNAAAGRLDLAYGAGERDRIDFFPAPMADAPLLVFFHGGYWQRGDKSVYSFIAEPFVARGVSVALVNYSQADVYEKAFGDQFPLQRCTVDGCDHFDMVQTLADGKSDFFRRALAFVTRRT